MIAKEENHWHEPKNAKAKALKGKEYYGFFWKGMPDLNFDNQEVRDEIKKIGW